MKRITALALAAGMMLAMLSGCGSDKGSSAASAAAPQTGSTAAAEAGSTAGTETASGADKIALVTDVGNIDDESFNQTCYEAMVDYGKEHNIETTYYKPTEDSTDARCISIDQAIKEGANVVVMPGYLFGGSIVREQEKYPEVYFIAVDVGAGDLTEDYATYYDPAANVVCATFAEEQAGYLAGYAVVMDGYTKLGFLGGMAVPAVVRYGYGFVQGADAAATELGADVSVNYVYGNQFSGDADITAYMDTWYANGTEVVFACGGGIYISAAEAAAKVGGKVIGVDVDQAAIIDAYGEGMTVTSAMKGLAPTVKAILGELILKDNWAQYAGQINTLGLVSGTDVEANYVQIPYESTQWSDTFTKDDYAALVAAMFDGTVTVSNDTETEPTVQTITVDYQGNIK